MEPLTTGMNAGTGTFRCADCDYVVGLGAVDRLPECPHCGGTTFVRASMFSGGTTTEAPAAHLDDEGAEDAWYEQARSLIRAPGEYLAYHDGDELRVLALDREWTRIGRSMAADVRFDDPTVSRRHALLVRRPDGVQVLDDRSLNGVFVNGDRVEWSPLRDGDEVVVGRHRLRFLAIPIVSGLRDPTLGEPLPS